MENQKNKTDYNVLKEQLRLLALEFNACDSFIQELDKVTCKKSFRALIRNNFEDICDKLLIDLEDYQDNEDLEDEIGRLKMKVAYLEDEIDDLKITMGCNNNSMAQDFKLEFYSQYQANYTEWELEELLKNGRNYLKNLKQYSV